MAEKKGEAKEVLGAVTGDRRVEAEGRAEQDGPADHVDEGSIQEEERAVRADHHDVPAGGAPGSGPLGT